MATSRAGAGAGGDAVGGYRAAGSGGTATADQAGLRIYDALFGLPMTNLLWTIS